MNYLNTPPYEELCIFFSEILLEIRLSECGDNAVLDCSQPLEEDLQPILREEVEIAVASLKKGKSAGVDNIPAELVQAGGETMIDVLTEICYRCSLENRRMAYPMDSVADYYTP